MRIFLALTAKAITEDVGVSDLFSVGQQFDSQNK